MSIHLGGSRSLTPSGLVGHVVHTILAQGQGIHVGCATGADHQVIQSALAAGGQSSLVVFAAFAPSGAGAWSGSAVAAVQAAARAGASVSWLAGGQLGKPLVARLMGRSRAALSGCSASVFFSPGPGSLAVAGFAVAAGQPVFAFFPAWPDASLSPRGCLGQWQPSEFLGFSCWQWQPAAQQPALF